TPLRIVDVLNGVMVFIALRMLVISGVLVLVLTAFGTVHSVPGAVAAAFAGGLLGLAHAAPTVAYSAHITSDAGFAPLFRIGIIPMMLFSGAFFPVDQLPVVVQWLAYLMPIWHGVELTRMCTSADVSWLAVVPAVYRLMLAVAGWWRALGAVHAKPNAG